MKTILSTGGAARRSGTVVPEATTHAPAQQRRVPERAANPALPGFARRLVARLAGKPVAARVPLERLEQFGRAGAQAPAAPAAAPRPTLGALLHSERPTPTTRAYMKTLKTRKTPPPAAAGAARPAIGRLASGPKVDAMADPLMSMHDLDERQLSQLTCALGLGPAAAPGPDRADQIEAAGQVLMGAMDFAEPPPDSMALKRLQFGRGLPPEQLQDLLEAAARVGCTVSERPHTTAQGEGVHLLQLHFAPGLDAGELPLAAEPESPAFEAVQAFAAHFAEALAPVLRTDGQRFELEFVACDRVPGGSADVFADHLAGKIHLARAPARLALDPEIVMAARLRNSQLFSMLSPAEKEQLVEAARVCHMGFRERVVRDADGNTRLAVRLFFGGTQNMRDVKQAFSSAGGAVGKVFGATRQAALLVAAAIKNAQADGRAVGFDHIAGGSMGGASAQLFAAGIGSRVRLDTPAPLVLFDPQLPNDAQARHAVKGGTLDYDYAAPRGVAVTLDYAKRPRKGLMGRMKGLGFKSPGLVRLKLALSDYDGVKRTAAGEYEQAPPEPMGPPGMGYHADAGLYKMALKRFTGRIGLR